MAASIEQDWELVPSPAEETNAPVDSCADKSSRRFYSTGFGIALRTKPKDRIDSLHATQKKKFYIIIKTGLLIPGDGEPSADAALVVENKLIAWVGTQADLPQEYTDAPHRSYSVPYLMPGLWDCHTHFEGSSISDSAGSYIDFLTRHPATAGARLTRHCWEAIQRGYTSIRDLAGFGCEVAKAVEDGTIVGPNIYSAGACLSQTAGHGDIHPIPAGDVLLNFGVSTVTPGHFGTGMSVIVDGVDECRRAVRLQIRRGAKCIKLLASGGVMSRDDNPINAQFSPEELACIVLEAARQDRAVAAHVHGKAGILAAVEAGVTTVEHVSFADRECIDLMKAKGTVYVATRAVVDALLQTGGEGLTKESWEKAKLVATNHLTAYKMAIEAGLTIALGTDSPPGMNQAVELQYAVEAGMSNLEAIKAATANGPLTVRGQAPKTGKLKAGYEADMLGLTENPVEDVKVLQDQEVIKWVWKGGNIFKGPGVGPWGEGPGLFE